MENIDIELLINLVRIKPYLYDKSERRYKDMLLKENAWKEIGETLLVTGKTGVKLLHCVPSINIMFTATTAAKVWKSLKEKFARERKKKRILHSGMGMHEKSNWTWFEDLSFLDRCIAKRNTMSNFQLFAAQNQNTAAESTCSSQSEVVEEAFYAHGAPSPGGSRSSSDVEHDHESQEPSQESQEAVIEFTARMYFC